MDTAAKGTDLRVENHDGNLVTIMQIKSHTPNASDDAELVFMGPEPTADPAQKAIGERIKARRLYLRYTQQEAADILGVKRNTYTNYELGNNAISSRDLPKLARTLNCTVAYLFGEEGLTSAERTQSESDAQAKNEQDNVIAVIMMRFFNDLPKRAKLRALRLMVEETVGGYMRPDLSERHPRPKMLKYAQKFSVSDFILQLERDEEA